MKRNIVLPIIILIFSLVLLEIVLRILGIMEAWSEINSGKYISPYRIEEMSNLYSYTPNTQGQYNCPEYNYKLKISSMGIRDIEHSFNVAENELRILVLGDSFAEGMGVAYTNGWVKVFEKNLNSKLYILNKRLQSFNKKRKIKKVVLICAGISGSDPFFEYDFYMKRLYKYNPDIIIMSINGTDINDVIVRGGMERFNNSNKDVYSTQPWFEPIFAYSRILRLILINLFGYNWLLLSKRDMIKRVELAKKKLKSLFFRFNYDLTKKSIRFYLLFHPLMNEIKRKSYDYDLKNFIETIESSGIITMDILPEFIKRTKGEPEKYFWSKDHHCNEKGYKLFGEIVTEDFLNII